MVCASTSSSPGNPWRAPHWTPSLPTSPSLPTGEDLWQLCSRLSSGDIEVPITKQRKACYFVLLSTKFRLAASSSHIPQAHKLLCIYLGIAAQLLSTCCVTHQRGVWTRLAHSGQQWSFWDQTPWHRCRSVTMDYRYADSCFDTVGYALSGSGKHTLTSIPLRGFLLSAWRLAST